MPLKYYYLRGSADRRFASNCICYILLINSFLNHSFIFNRRKIKNIYHNVKNQTACLNCHYTNCEVSIQEFRIMYITKPSTPYRSTFIVSCCIFTLKSTAAILTLSSHKPVLCCSSVAWQPSQLCPNCEKSELREHLQIHYQIVSIYILCNIVTPQTPFYHDARRELPSL